MCGGGEGMWQETRKRTIRWEKLTLGQQAGKPIVTRDTKREGYSVGRELKLIEYVLTFFLSLFS